MTPYRIILADDHVMLRDGIKRIIDAAKGMRVVGEASDGLTLLEMLPQTAADMIILDVTMPRMGGIEAAHEIRKRHPPVKMLFLSMHNKREYLQMALDAGARGYLLKEDSGGELINAINTVRKGGTYLSRVFWEDMPGETIGIRGGNDLFEKDPLTTREREVLKLIAGGKTSKEIAAHLFISIHTVHHHRKNIRQKLSLRKNADLIKYAVQQGYVP